MDRLKLLAIKWNNWKKLHFCLFIKKKRKKERRGKMGRERRFSSVQFSHSVVSDSCDPMDCNTPGLPVHHKLPESTYTHVHRVGDAIQPSLPLSSPSPPAPNPSQGSFQISQLYASGGQSIGVSASTSVLPMNTQDWSPLGWIGWISLHSKGLSRVFSNMTVQKHQFFSAQLSL